MAQDLEKREAAYEAERSQEKAARNKLQVGLMLLDSAFAQNQSLKDQAGNLPANLNARTRFKLRISDSFVNIFNVM